MPHYIRFLKPPKLIPRGKGSYSVSALITITTDLGDSFLPEEVDLIAVLQFSSTAHTSKTKSLRKQFSWKASSRELPITIGPCQFDIKKDTATFHVSFDRDNVGGELEPDVLGPDGTPSIVSASSAPFGSSHGVQAKKLIERRFIHEVVDAPLVVWEETGNSVARHIWDAALACDIEFYRAYRKLPGAISSLQSLFHSQRTTPLNTIELGSGCGIVGIALARVVPQCSVLLTDLDEVHDIITRNISLAKPARDSSVQFEELDWDNEELPNAVSSRRHDLILVSDCTYNPDSFGALVRTLVTLTDASPRALVLVALKRRHDSEIVFLDLMRDAGFAIDERAITRLPDLCAEDGMVDIETYVFRRSRIP